MLHCIVHLYKLKKYFLQKGVLFFIFISVAFFHQCCFKRLKNLKKQNKKENIAQNQFCYLHKRLSLCFLSHNPTSQLKCAA